MRVSLVALLSVSLSCCSLALPGSKACAQVVQLEASVTGQQPWNAYAGPGGALGVILGDHAVLETGVTFSRFERGGDYGGTTTAFSVPLGLVLYLKTPERNVITPSMRLFGAYSRMHDEYRMGVSEDGSVARGSNTRRGWGGSALVGATYFVTDHFGVSAELGPSFTYSTNKSTSSAGLAGLAGRPDDSETWELLYRLGVALRL